MNKQTTETFLTWLRNSEDEIKARYAINWRLPHTLFNISCKYFDSNDIQDVDWERIFKGRDIGKWTHGDKVNCW